MFCRIQTSRLEKEANQLHQGIVYKICSYKITKNRNPSHPPLSALPQLPPLSVRAHHNFQNLYVFCNEKFGRLHLKNSRLKIVRTGKPTFPWTADAFHKRPPKLNGMACFDKAMHAFLNYNQNEFSFYQMNPKFWIIFQYPKGKVLNYCPFSKLAVNSFHFL